MRVLCMILLGASLLLAQSPIPCTPSQNAVNEPPEPDLSHLGAETAAMFMRGLLQIKHLRPAAFPAVSPSVQRALEARGCQVPQVLGDSQPSNLVHGEFARRGQTDWAALCSTNRRFELVIVWGGAARCDVTTLRAPEMGALQQVAKGEAGFGEAIEAITPKQMQGNASVQGLKLTFNPTHDGLTYEWVGKGSVVCYCQAGKWLRGEGTD
jgi:hypothetical protein